MANGENQNEQQVVGTNEVAGTTPDTPPTDTVAKRQYSCATCDFKGPSPRAVMEHYQQNPTHRKSAKVGRKVGKVGKVGRPKGSKNRKTSKTAGRPRVQRKVSLDALSVEDLQTALAERQARVDTVREQRETLIQQLAALDKALALVPGVAPVRRGRKAGRKSGHAGRPKGSKNRKGRKTGPKAAKRGRKAGKKLTLHAAIGKVLRNRKNGVKASVLVKAVKKAGFKSSSKNIYPQIAQALSDKKRYVRVERGVYKTK